MPTLGLHWCRLIMVACLMAGAIAPRYAGAAQPGRSITPMLQERLGLSEQQVRGALGALLVYARERLPEPDFNQFAQTIPNADRIMQEVKLRGIVTGPLDTIEEYEASLSSIGIDQPLASQVAPAIVQALGEAGFERERDALTRIIN